MRNKVHDLWIRCARSPLFWILCTAAILRIAGIFWGLPAADGWDDDGVAPRNFLVGIIQTYTPGAHFTYPPFHMLLLAVLTAPGWIIALLQAPTLHQHDVIATITQVPYMTYFAVVARIVSLLFSLGTIFVVAKMAELLAGRRAGLFAAAACALNGGLTYYGQVTNLDGPAAFWAVLSLWFCMRVIAGREPRHIRWAALAAAAAVATKDQAYAVFLISVPVAFGAWFILDDWPRRNAGRVLAAAAVWSVVAVLAVLLVDGAITNPHGFADRFALLTGSASRDYAEYQSNWAGWAAMLHDMWANTPRYYPAIALLLAGVGVAQQAWRSRLDAHRMVAGALPLLAAISFTLAFDFVVRRTETRFLLPQSVFIAVYIGIGVEALAFADRRWLRLGSRIACVAVACYALYLCAGVEAAFLADPRYDAEHWIQSHLRPGDRVETYGLNAYLPHFPAGAVVTRVGPKPLKRRNPLPNVVELRQPYRDIAERRPRFIVVPGFWVQDYLASRPGKTRPGRAIPEVRLADYADADARGYFGALFNGNLPYRLAHKSFYSLPLGPGRTAYESLTQPIFIFERVAGKPSLSNHTGLSRWVVH